MKIIIAHASAGAGHFKAAEALSEQFRRDYPDIEIKLIDALDYTSPFFKNSYLKGYSFMVNYASWLWSLSFYLTTFKPTRWFINGLHFFINSLNTAKLRSFLIRENPDYIVSTHFLPAQVAAYLKEKKQINSRLLTVITDFGIHQFWLAKGTDIYAVASDFSRQLLVREGIAENKIKVTGIPVDNKFLFSFDRGALSGKLGLDKNKFTVLLVTGSFGIGPLEQIVDYLHNDAQLIVVCARNKKLYQRLNQKNYPGLKVFGFVDNIQELMACSDVIITKPGGLTVSEVLVMELPPLFISAIPGQETVNAQFLVKEGIANTIANIKDTRIIIRGYKDNPQKLDAIKEAIRCIKKPHAAGDICHALCSGSSGPSG